MIAIFLAVAVAAGAQPPQPTAGQVQAQHESWAAEATRIKASPGFARRTGDLLTVNSGSKTIAQFADGPIAYCEGYDSCSLWTFAGTIKVSGSEGLKDHPIVSHYNGEITETVVVDTDGRIVWLPGAPRSSPSGRYLAAAAEDETEDGTLTIRDWRSSGHAQTVSFPGDSCAPVKWRDDTLLISDCQRYAGDILLLFPAEIRFKDGQWVLRETGPLDAKTRKPVAAALGKPRTIRGQADAPPSPKQVADDTVYEQKAGYKRLKP